MYIKWMYFYIERHALNLDGTERKRARHTPQKITRIERNKSGNTGKTSVDRSTRATLDTYNTWILLSRLQRIYRFQGGKLQVALYPFAR